MPRRREVPKRRIIPDPKFKDKLVSKFTNTLMFDGEKAVAEGILYGSFDVIGERYKEDPLEVFRKALDNVKTMKERLAAEFVDAAQGRGNAVKKKDDTHKMAEANKAFAHYRW